MCHSFTFQVSGFRQVKYRSTCSNIVWIVLCFILTDIRTVVFVVATQPRKHSQRRIQQAAVAYEYEKIVNSTIKSLANLSRITLNYCGLLILQVFRIDTNDVSLCFFQTNSFRLGFLQPKSIFVVVCNRIGLLEILFKEVFIKNLFQNTYNVLEC